MDADGERVPIEAFEAFEAFAQHVRDQEAWGELPKIAWTICGFGKLFHERIPEHLYEERPRTRWLRFLEWIGRRQLTYGCERCGHPPRCPRHYGPEGTC